MSDTPLDPNRPAQRFAYSNRAPGKFMFNDKKQRYELDEEGRERFKEDFVGGAARVVFDSGIDAWIAPGRGYKTRKEYDDLPDEKKFPTTPRKLTFKGKKIDLYLFPYVEEDRKAHYRFANVALWPLHHNMDPFYFTHPGEPVPPELEAEKYRAFQLNKAQGEEGLKSYEDFNEQYANKYIQELIKAGVFRKGKDKLDVHDYQCANVTTGVKGEAPEKSDDMFLFHIPIPNMDYLQNLREPMQDAKGQTTYEASLLEHGGWFNRYLDHILENHSTINCQRPGDQKKLLKLIAYFHRDVAVDNLVYDANNKDGVHRQEKGHSGVEMLDYLDNHGKRRSIRILNIPVGTSQEENLLEAKAYEYLFSGIKPNGDGDRMPTAPDGATITHDPEYFDAEHLNKAGYNLLEDQKFSAAQLLRKVLAPGKGFMINAHRDDPSKAAFAQIEAAKMLYEAYPDARKKMPFVLFIGPSRDEIDEYKAYHEAVLKEVRLLKEDPYFKDAFIIIPQEIKHFELMALLRHPNMKIKLDAAPWDGHALTAREPADVRIDWSPEELRANPPAVVMPSGIGASDILKGDKDNEGAIVFDTHANHKAYVESMGKALIKAYELQYNKDGSPNVEGRKKLAGRYDVIAKASKEYSGEFYGKTVHAVSDGITIPRERRVPEHIVREPMSNGTLSDYIDEAKGLADVNLGKAALVIDNNPKGLHL